MDLYEFIKQKVQVDELYDYEIASLLEVERLESSQSGEMPNGIKRATGFSRRFDRRYGEGAVERFKKIIEKPTGNTRRYRQTF